jgi:hypothetical protein
MEQPPSPQVSSQIERLRQAHPLWAIGSKWISSASGPDYRLLTATRQGTQVSGASAGDLSARITEQERLHGWDS